MEHIKIIKKKIKSIVLKIDNNGNISLSVPNFLSDKEIRDFINSKKSWITEKKEKINKIPKNEYLSFFFLGEKIDFSSLIISDSHKLFLKKESYSSENRKKLIKIFYEEKAFEIILPLIKKYSDITGLEFNHISFKFMDTRWGSCNCKKKYLNFNNLLIASPIEAIEYVILHEIAHLKFPHHKKEFYDFISIYMPDWNARKSKLIYFSLK